MNGSCESEPLLLRLTKRTWAFMLRFCRAPTVGALGLRLALCAVVLSATTLLLGFYLDDYIGRYVYSDLEGAARLFRNYSGGYGVAIGDPVENHWQMEAGWAPWWQLEQLRLALYRPIGVLVHQLDFRLWRDDALPMRVHSLLWLAALIAATTWMYRVVLGAVVGGAAALLFAFDHTHAFAVGHICNRHALIGAMLAALGLGLHVRSRTDGRVRHALAAALCYVLGLLTSESTIALTGYIVAYELLARTDSLRARAFAVAPYVLITMVWRVAYDRGGFGAYGSGIYIDMARQPLAYLYALLERGPILWTALMLQPPAEIHALVPDALARWVLVWSVLVTAASIWVLVPLLREDRTARFWALGSLGSLVPAAAVVPHNRLLILTSVGAMGLLAQLWQRYATATPDALRTRAQQVAAQLGMVLVAGHVILSPLLMPFETISLVLSAPMHNGAASLGDQVAGRDLVFVTTPDQYTLRIMQAMKRLEGAPLPRTIRTLSGVSTSAPRPLTVTRSGPQSLDVHFHGGLMPAPISDLHRDRSIGMPAGTQVHLEGFDVEVLQATADQQPERVRFRFAHVLEDPQLQFYRWDHEGRFVAFQPPPLGASVELMGAKLRAGLGPRTPERRHAAQ